MIYLLGRARINQDLKVNRISKRLSLRAVSLPGTLIFSNLGWGGEQNTEGDF